jgi:two-component system phosphate regulon response regulator PhoB
MQRSGIILIVDDQQDDVALISYALSEAGLENPVRWLRDGSATIHYLSRGHAPDHIPLLMLIDWNMPRTNTAEVLKWIRQQPECLDLLIIVLTGSEDPLQKQLAYEAGANWHFVKSGNFGDLVQLVRRIQDFWSSDIPAQPSVKLPNRRVD